MWRSTERFQRLIQGSRDQVDVFFTSLGLTSHVMDDNLPYEVQDGSSTYTVDTTYGVIESIKRFIATDTVKALMSLGDAWMQAFSDWVGEVHLQYKQECHHIAVLNDGALS